MSIRKECLNLYDLNRKLFKDYFLETRDLDDLDAIMLVRNLFLSEIQGSNIRLNTKLSLKKLNEAQLIARKDTIFC